MRKNLTYALGNLAQSTIYLWVTAAILAGYSVALALYIHSERQIHQAYERRHQSYLLADELRHSCDDLTRMARTYVITDDIRFKQRYEEILDIRNGRKPRPVDYYNVYWDLVTADDQRPRPFGEAVDLLELMRRAGFTAEEFAKLEESKNASDDQTQTERVAMALLESSFPRSEDSRARAIRILHDPAYHLVKIGVLRPISELHAMVSHRTQAEIDSAIRKTKRLRLITIVSGGVLALLLWLTLAAINREKQEKSNSEALFRAVFDNAAVGLVQFDKTGRFINANPEFCRILGYSRDELLSSGLTLQQVIVPEDHQAAWASYSKIFEGDTDQFFAERRCLRKDGQIIIANAYIHPMREIIGVPQSFISAIIDVTENNRADAELERYRNHLQQLVEERTVELQNANRQLTLEIATRKQATRALEESEHLFRFIAENSADVIWIIDIPTRKFTYVSPSILRLRGLPPSDMIGKPLDEVLMPEAAKQMHSIVDESIAQQKAGRKNNISLVLETRQLHEDGRMVDIELVATIFPDEGGRPKSMLGIARDITERKKAEDAIRQLAFHDPLTQLANRRLLLERMQQEIAHAKRDKTRLALLFIDLDRFKPINDDFGHQTGDRLLQAVARRIQGCIRESDTAARIGGDEFVVLLPDHGKIEDVERVAEKIRVALQAPFLVAEETRFEISCSIGIAVFPDHADNEVDLLNLGDDAMYSAKNKGGNRYSVYKTGAPVHPGTPRNKPDGQQ